MTDIAARVQEQQAGSLPGVLGFQWLDVRPGFVRGRLDIAPRHMSPNGFLHAATVVAIADSACGFGCTASLPKAASSFTTAELKANFIGTAREGSIACDAQLVHGGRSTQVWDATVRDERTGKIIALFRCTQILLYAQAG